MSEDDFSDDEIKKLEQELKELESKDTSYGSPPSQDKDNLFKFFKHILEMKDTTRVAKLNQNEIGSCNLSQRGYKRIATYAQAEGLDIVASYLNAQAEIMSSTSMGKDGFWPQLFVTNIKKNVEAKPKEVKKSWFSKKEQNEGE